MESNTQKGLYLFRLFFTGMMSAFTSGMAAIPVIEKGIVEKKKWMTDKEFWAYPPFSQTLPGVISIHNAILLGNRIAGPFGSLMAFLGTIMPAFLGMLVIAALFQSIVNNRYVQGAIRGIRVVSVALIMGNAARLLQNTEKNLFSLIIVILAAAIPLFFGFSAFWTIISCGIAGILSMLICPDDPTKQAAGTGKAEE